MKLRKIKRICLNQIYINMNNNISNVCYTTVTYFLFNVNKTVNFHMY